MNLASLLVLLAPQAVQDPTEEEAKIKDKQAEITAFVKTSKTEKDLRVALDELKVLADRAYQINRYELSERLLGQAEAIARSLRSAGDVQTIQSSLKKTKEVRRDYERVKKAFDALLQGNGTPEDSTTVGKFYCFIKGDWDFGLKTLSGGKDELLKDLATKDLAGAETSEAQIALAEAWGALGQKTPAAKERSLHWYKSAWPGLKGITRERIRAKFKDLSQRGTKENRRLPEQWAFYTRQGAQLGEVKELVLEDGVSPSGGRSLRIMPWIGIFSSSRFPLKPNTEYTLSYWVMTDSVPSLETNAIRLVINGTDASNSHEIGLNVAPDQPWWEKVTKTFTTPDFAATGNFTIRITIKEGRLWLDDFSVTSSETRANVMDNGSFETMK